MGRDACARGVYKGGLYRGRGEVGGWFACGKTWWLGWACGRKRVFKFRQHNRFFLYCTQCKSKVLHFRRYNLPLSHTIIMVAKSLVRAFFEWK